MVLAHPSRGLLLFSIDISGSWCASADVSRDLQPLSAICDEYELPITWALADLDMGGAMFSSNGVGHEMAFLLERAVQGSESGSDTRHEFSANDIQQLACARSKGQNISALALDQAASSQLLQQARKLGIRAVRSPARPAGLSTRASWLRQILPFNRPTLKGSVLRTREYGMVDIPGCVDLSRWNHTAFCEARLAIRSAGRAGVCVHLAFNAAALLTGGRRGLQWFVQLASLAASQQDYGKLTVVTLSEAAARFGRARAGQSQSILRRAA